MLLLHTDFSQTNFCGQSDEWDSEVHYNDWMQWEVFLSRASMNRRNNNSKQVFQTWRNCEPALQLEEQTLMKMKLQVIVFYNSLIHKM